MAVLRKTFEATSDQYVSLEDEISQVSNKLFFETFLDAIVQLRASCSLSSCWEIPYLFRHYLHRDMAVREVNNTSRMAVPVFKSPKKYFKMIDLKDIKVIQHSVAFKTALTTLSFRDNFSVESIFSQALLIIVSLLSRKSFAIVMAMERISVQCAKNTKQLNLFLQSACQYYDCEEGLAETKKHGCVTFVVSHSCLKEILMFT